MKKAILGKKLGMTQIFTSEGLVIPVTVVEAGPCFVTQVKTVERMVMKQYKLLSMKRERVWLTSQN